MKIKLTEEELKILIKSIGIAQLDIKRKMLNYDVDSDLYLIYLKELQEINRLYEKIKSGR